MHVCVCVLETHLIPLGVLLSFEETAIFPAVIKLQQDFVDDNEEDANEDDAWNTGADDHTGFVYMNYRGTFLHKHTTFLLLHKRWLENKNEFHITLVKYTIFM